MSIRRHFKGSKHLIILIIIGVIVLWGLIESVHDNAQREASDNRSSNTEQIWIEKDQDSVLVYQHGRSWQTYGSL